MLPIKVCGITREQDLEMAVSLGASAVGFILYPPSPRAISTRRATELARCLPAFVTPVLLFVNASAEEILQVAQTIPASWIQFHGDESGGFCQQVGQTLNRPWIRAISVKSTGLEQNISDMLRDYGQASAWLFDAFSQAYGGAGKTFDWSVLPRSIPAHLVLAGGLHAGNVGEAVTKLSGVGKSLALDVNSGVESSPGIKSAHKMVDFFAAVRACS
ncbi:MAG: phosphoribosylanthranilate isomerase [Gammaproteobacteria bacterium]|nr:phosphoribosylanthranilate isomerase [Gammaproteobacteria bacterium]